MDTQTLHCEQGVVVNASNLREELRQEDRVQGHELEVSRAQVR